MERYADLLDPMIAEVFNTVADQIRVAGDDDIQNYLETAISTMFKQAIQNTMDKKNMERDQAAEEIGSIPTAALLDMLYNGAERNLKLKELSPTYARDVLIPALQQVDYKNAREVALQGWDTLEEGQRLAKLNEDLRF
jgi:hypothetical protein